MSKNILPITPSVLHKSEVDDVFVGTPRLLMPASVERASISGEGAEALTACGLYRVSDNGETLRATLPTLAFNQDYCSVDPQDEAIGSQPSLSDLLHSETVRLPFSVLYHANVNTTHYYFYRKEHEHVPGLMLIEIARQAMYHYVYSSYDHRRGEVTISMSSLDVVFEEYTDSALPLDLIVSQVEPVYSPQPKYVEMEAAFYQRGRRVGTVKLVGGVMKLSLFKRLRRFDPPPKLRFEPSANVVEPVLLVMKDGALVDAPLKYLSMSEIAIGRPKDKTALDVERAILYSKSQGHLGLPVVSSAYDDDAVILHLEAKENGDSYRLREFIKLNCVAHPAEVERATP